MSLELGRHVHKSYKQNSDHFLYVLQGIWIPANPLAHRGILVSFKGNIVDLLGVPMALHTREVPVQLRLCACASTVYSLEPQLAPAV